jgi:hypothetical protein
MCTGGVEEPIYTVTKTYKQFYNTSNSLKQPKNPSFNGQKSLFAIQDVKDNIHMPQPLI